MSLEEALIEDSDRSWTYYISPYTGYDSKLGIGMDIYVMKRPTTFDRTKYEYRCKYRLAFDYKWLDSSFAYSEWGKDVEVYHNDSTGSGVGFSLDNSGENPVFSRLGRITSNKFSASYGYYEKEIFGNDWRTS